VSYQDRKGKYQDQKKEIVFSKPWLKFLLRIFRSALIP
jgi:hypothetical protein